MQGPTESNNSLGSYFCNNLVQLNTNGAIALMLDRWNYSEIAGLQLYIKICLFASCLLLRAPVQFSVCSAATNPRSLALNL